MGMDALEAQRSAVVKCDERVGARAMDVIYEIVIAAKAFGMQIETFESFRNRDGAAILSVCPAFTTNPLSARAMGLSQRSLCSGRCLA
jgi:hypothetical protein